MNLKATEVILKALASDILNHEGKFYRFKNVRIASRPMQQPHPPLWFAPIEPSRAADAARLKGNIVTLVPDAGVKALTDAYRAAWQADGNSAADIPLLGVFRHVVVAETDAKAQDAARSAYRLWRHHMAFLWECGLPRRVRGACRHAYGRRRLAGNGPPLCRRHRREDRHQLFRRRHDLRLAVLRSGGALRGLVRKRGNARIPVTDRRR
jgi:alkanesulfonate monooxygenase SsuD/methylene tetrahydromethanopterin reductase-like flavin-dependent oxidoreductase (luciferase family)